MLGRYTFQEVDEDEEFEEQTKEEDVVTPYSISNKTNAKLLIKRLNTNIENDESRGGD